MKVIRSALLHRELKRVLDHVEDGEQYTVTRYRRPSAVIVPGEWHREAAALMAAREQASNPRGGC